MWSKRDVTLQGNEACQLAWGHVRLLYETKMEQTFAMTIIISYMVCRSNNIFFFQTSYVGTYRRSNLTKKNTTDEYQVRNEFPIISIELLYFYIFFLQNCKFMLFMSGTFFMIREFPHLRN